jgi:hypothetical protein
VSDKGTIRIGGASGYWGDAALATPQLLKDQNLDFLVYDFLAEITMAILARVNAKDSSLGYATDFVENILKPHLKDIANQKIKVISNAGGMNPEACANVVRSIIKEQGLSLKVITVIGDNLLAKEPKTLISRPNDMFTGAKYPNPEKISSINAYLGAFPIAKALEMGADIVITGRCVDSAVTLGAAIYSFNWSKSDLDKLAMGSLIGHLLECGTQVTGGNFTDWELVGNSFEEIGYPIAEINNDGSAIITKPDQTGGIVNIGTVSEQLVYEIGDPQNYLLPDVTCDFSEVCLRQNGKNAVQVSGAKGRSAPNDYKTCLTYSDGFRGGHLFQFYGIDADKKALVYANAALRRSENTLRNKNLESFSEISKEIIGAESHFGSQANNKNVREVAIKVAVRHPDSIGVGVFLKEATGLGLSAPPGLSGFAGARPKPSPVMSLFSFLTPKSEVEIKVQDLDHSIIMEHPPREIENEDMTRLKIQKIDLNQPMTLVPIIRLAYARSGDKGNGANIGVIARKKEFLPYLWHGLTEVVINDIFGHFNTGRIKKYLLPGINAMNIQLDSVLGGNGGTSSLRSDPQGKGYSQLILSYFINIPEAFIEDLHQ